jgi:hypothetical protein
MFLALISLPLFLGRIHSWCQVELIVGVLALWWAVQTFREKLHKYRSRGWPITTGTISNIAVRKVSGGLNGVDYWKASFDYSYSVTQPHSASYSFNCVSEEMAAGAVAGLKDKAVCVHYSPSDESKCLLWEDEVWDIWWDTYWQLSHGTATVG